MNALEAKKRLEEKYDARMDALLASMLTELTDQPNQFPEIIQRYHGLATNHMEARATVATFIETVFKE